MGSLDLTSVILEINNFIVDRRARGLSHNTIDYYTRELKLFNRWCEAKNIVKFKDVTAGTIRTYMIELAERRTAYGLHAMWRALKIFYRWYEVEEEPKDWRNPMAHIAAPKLPGGIPSGISLDDFQKLIDICGMDDLGKRDRAMFYVLLDTGIRRQELLDLTVDDLQLNTGIIAVRHGKGDRPRSVFIGSRTIKVVIRYLRTRANLLPEQALFAESRRGGFFTTKGLDQILKHRAEQAGIDKPGFHDFRRTFTIEALRNGADLLSLARMLGHADLSLLQRYAKQTDADLLTVHARSSPVDKARL